LGGESPDSGGESVEIVLRHSRHPKSVRAANMAGVGTTLPIHIGDAFAVSLAEVIGSAVLLRDALSPEIEVTWSSGFNPTDFSTGSMVLGAPEYVLLLVLRDQANSYMHRELCQPKFQGGIWSMAKLPGAQACAQKSSMMTLAALFDQRRFSFAGALSLDEVYSPEQLLYDLEIKDHVSRLVRGFDDPREPDRCLSDLEQAVKEGGFIGLETTARLFRSVYWAPSLFERSPLGNWRTLGSPSLRERAATLLKQALLRHDYRLAPEPQSQIDTILHRARQEAGLPANLELPPSLGPKP